MAIKAFAAMEAKGKLTPYEYNPGELKSNQVEIDVEYCGLCHSDMSIIDNEWSLSQYPLVPGHEVVGRISAVGSGVQSLQVGQRVGLGWFSNSCLHCDECLSGDHNLCASNEHLIVMSKGGFANKVRCQDIWAIPIPEEIDAAFAGPLFCAGITVFNPIIQNNIKSIHRVGVIGIGGLGHLALKFLRAWGCEVTAFSTSESKKGEVLDLGAHNFVNTRKEGALEGEMSKYDLILVTANASLSWDAYIAALKPKGKLHFVGAAPQVSATLFPMIVGQKSIGASPLGSPRTMKTMLDFAVRHNILPKAECFPLSKVNDAIDKLRNEKPAHRLVLQNDL